MMTYSFIYNMVSCFVTENMIIGDFYRGGTIVTCSCYFYSMFSISIFLSLSSSGGGIPMWIGALQVVIKKTSQHTTLGFGHVSLFFFFFLITGLYLVLYLYNRGGDVSFKIYEYQLDPIPEL